MKKYKNTNVLENVIKVNQVVDTDSMSQIPGKLKFYNEFYFSHIPFKLNKRT